MTSLQRNCLTGPHTFIASSFTSTHSPCGSSVETNAIKASVPKLFNCPGSRFPSPSQESFSAAASRPLVELTTPWDLSPGLISDAVSQPLVEPTASWDRSPSALGSLPSNKHSRTRFQQSARSPLGSRAVQNHNPYTPPHATLSSIHYFSRLASTPLSLCHY